MKEKEKIEEMKIKIIKKTLKPVWNEEYHFPIKSLRKDILIMPFKNYDSIKKDDGISTYEVKICSLPLGKVMDKCLILHLLKR